MTSFLLKTILAGASIGGLTVEVALAQPPAKPQPATAPDTLPLADPLTMMLGEAKTSYARVRDYTCIFTRQESINGTLTAEQVGEMKVRTQPASVLIRFAKPEAATGMEILWNINRPDGKVRYRPAPTAKKGGAIVLSASDPKFAAEFRHSPAELGIGKTIELLSTIAAREKGLNNAIETFSADFQFAGKAVTRYEIYTRRGHAARYAYRCVVYIDKETKLPLRFEAYDTPKPGGAAGGELMERYSYTDVKFNVGLGESVFEY